MKNQRFIKLCVSLLIVLVPVASVAEEVRIKDYKDLDAYFTRVGFTQENWQKGIREVPNFSFGNVREQWRKETVLKIDVATKKRLFFRALAPFALRANLAVKEERNKLLELITQVEKSNSDHEWLNSLAVKYRVVKEVSGSLNEKQLEELSRRVDIIPPSLILAQSAEESGWGTSRFTSEGNSLFGQWTWGENAMKPRQQRSELGDYGLARFDTIQDAVKAYVRNLNSGSAYVELRRIREDMRKGGGSPRGYGMAAGLLRYSERGQEYIDSLRTIMRVNRLADTDFAYLADTEEVVFVFTEE